MKLAILTTHPIQYQVPLWQQLAKENKVTFEVWYLTDHGTKNTHDKEFGKTFSWDLNMLDGYPYRFLKVNEDASVNSFKKLRIEEDLQKLFKENKITHLWIQGWQVLAYWQAVRAARKAGVKLILRAESNDLSKRSLLKRVLKYFPMKYFFNPINYFLYIGKANKRLYKSYGVKESQLLPGHYCVDNERFRMQADKVRMNKSEIRRKWNINGNDFCILFCGKFIHKKNPSHIIEAANSLTDKDRIHLLFVGSGELENDLKQRSNVVFPQSNNQNEFVKASFVGFLNQTQISEAYVAADCLILPSDYNETWGLVVNEAMANGLPCIVSDQCGCAEDLIKPLDKNLIFEKGNINDLARAIGHLMAKPLSTEVVSKKIDEYSIDITIHSVSTLLAD